MSNPAAGLPATAVSGRTYRLVPTRFPPVQTFDDVTSPEDLLAVMELEDWTNDRIVVQRLNRLPRDKWVYGRSCSSVVMAAFLHTAADGCRFNGPDIGAWYCSPEENTSLAEVAHHLRREAVNSGMPHIESQYCSYCATLTGQYVDIRGAQATHPSLYASADYSASQAFGEGLRAAEADGIVYDSLRRSGGVCIVAYQPPNVLDVVPGTIWRVRAYPDAPAQAWRN